VRYSFHGKVRATGQQVDGYVEAASSTEAIDRLADQGIIGVHTVRPEAKKPRNTVILSGEEMFEDEEMPKALPAPAAPIAAAPVSQQPIYIPVPMPAAAPAVSGATEQVLGTLVEKLSTLLGQVEKLLSRPQQIVYQSGPARGGGDGGKKRAPRGGNDAQDKTLAAIFQTNMDLRKSLEKLSTITTGPATGGTNGTANGSANVSGSGSGNGSGNGPIAALPSPRENGSKSFANGRERALQAQPAA
jgi:hypothetical protein